MPLPVGLGSGTPEGSRKGPSKARNYIHKAVRCSKCRKVGLLAFDSGFSTAMADKLMNGRPVVGDCGYCHRRGVEMIPIPKLTLSDAKELRALYTIQDTLEKAAERNMPIDRRAVILPWAKVEEINKRGRATS